MNLNEYQSRSKETAVYPEKQALEYLALGLASEAGEFAGKVKKLLRDNRWDKEEAISELGDVFWYLVRLADTLGEQSETILDKNFYKLQDRRARGVLGGSGDNR